MSMQKARFLRKLRSRRGFSLVELLIVLVILGILAGLIVIQHPIWSPFVIGSTLVIILGVQGLIIGVIGLIQSFQGGGWGAAVLGGISILFGLLFLFNVGGFTLALPGAIGILALVGGVLSIVAAFRLK